ncbi:MAG: hypothetical protein JWM32_2705 [Verrucomicrobia bacterium]|nr:hypothetical protein [Verrucomicrobiota bacterium]
MTITGSYTVNQISPDSETGDQRLRITPHLTTTPNVPPNAGIYDGSKYDITVTVGVTPPQTQVFSIQSDLATIIVRAPIGTLITINDSAYTYQSNYGAGGTTTFEFERNNGTTETYILTDPYVSEKGDLGAPGSSKSEKNLVLDPVNITTGELYSDHIDLEINGSIPIKLRRTYSSKNITTNEFGYGWRIGYPTYLVLAPDLSTLSAADSDGTVVVMRRQGVTDTWLPTAVDNTSLTNTAGIAGNLFTSSIVKTVAGGVTTYEWKLGDGSTRTYVVRQFPVTSLGVTIPRDRPYLDKWTDNRGNALNFILNFSAIANGYGKIAQIRSTSGGLLDLAYDGKGRIITATADDGRSVSYGYSLGGDLTTVQAADATTWSYEYGHNGDDHRITKELRPGGSFLTNTYDGFGRVVTQAGVVIATYDYSVVGQTTVRDADQRATVFKYSNGGLTEVTDPLGNTTLKTWYATTDTPNGAYPGSLQSVTDPRGLVTTYRYDGAGNIIQTVITGDLLGDGVMTRTATTTALFDALNRPTWVQDPSGIKTTYAYADSNYPYSPTQMVTSKSGTTLRTDVLEYTAKLDPVQPTTLFSKGLLLRRTVASGGVDQAVVEYDYNTNGFLTQKTEFTGTADPAVVTTFTYNARRELLTTTDADSRSTTYTYDGLSRVLTKTAKESGVTVATWTTTYTGTGEVASTSGPQSAPSNLAQNNYDASGLLRSHVVSRSQAKSDGSGVEAAAVATTSYDYITNRNLWRITDPRGVQTLFGYDWCGRLTSRTTATTQTESFQYEPGGEVSQYTNVLGGITKFYYTTSGKIRRQENPDGSVLTWLYYADGRLDREYHTNGTYNKYDYDDFLNKITRTLCQAGGTILTTEISEYDRRGNLVRSTDAEGFVKTIVLDDLNRVKSITGPGATPGSPQQVATITYTASLKSKVTKNALNESVETFSDVIDRPVDVVTKSAVGAVVRKTHYNYSADHHAITCIEGTGLNALSSTIYVDAGRATVLAVAGDGTVTRTIYDASGNVLSVIDPLLHTKSYIYNSLNQPTRETLPDGMATTFTYNAAGQMEYRRMAGGYLVHQQSYDNAGRITYERLFSGSAESRQFTYSYYPAANVNVGQLATITGPRGVTTAQYDDLLRVQSVVTAGAETVMNSTTTVGYDRRNLVTSIDQSSVANAAGPVTHVTRTYDGYGQMRSEAITVAGLPHAAVTQTWDAAGRRATLDEASSTLGTPLFSYQHQANGSMTQVTANSLNYGFNYADNGLLTSRINSFRSMAVNVRDGAGRITQITNTVGSSAATTETMSWRADTTLNTYSLSRNGAWSETRTHAYNSRGQLVDEGYSMAPGQNGALHYTYDAGFTGIGIRYTGKEGNGAPAAWQSTAQLINTLGQVTKDQNTEEGRVVPASGVALGAARVDLLVDGTFLMSANHPGANDSAGVWSAATTILSGTRTLTANAVHPSGYVASATSTFTVPGAGSGGTIANSYDGEGNVTSRTWASGRSQVLTWDAFSRLIKVVDRDSANSGSDWTAIYDACGRRVRVIRQAISAGAASGSPLLTNSIFDPSVEFLEIGVAIDGVKAWKVYGPDLDGGYGSLQGIGGLEATIVDSSRATKGMLQDQFGNGVASVVSGAISWFSTRASGFGPVPGTPAEVLIDITRLAEATVWRGRRLDPTGFINMGARYYEPTSGRFLSPDPAGHGSSMSLYDYANGDPVNNVDADGRMGGPATRVRMDDGYARYAGNKLYPTAEAAMRGIHPSVAGQNSADPNQGLSIIEGVSAALAGITEGATDIIDSFREVPEDFGAILGAASVDPLGTYIGIGEHLDANVTSGIDLIALTTWADVRRDLETMGENAREATDLYINSPEFRHGVTKAEVATLIGISIGGVRISGELPKPKVTVGPGPSSLPSAAAETVSLRRPYLRNWVVDEVEANAPRAPDGRFIDPNTLAPTNNPVMGHKPGYEFWRLKDAAQAEGVSQKLFNETLNNPEFYHIEDRLSNAGHAFEHK